MLGRHYGYLSRPAPKKGSKTFAGIGEGLFMLLPKNKQEETIWSGITKPLISCSKNWAQI